MPTVSTVLSYAENKSQAGVGTLNNPTLGVPFLNEALLDYRLELIKRGVDASQVQESYIPTVTIPTYPNSSTFPYPTDMFFLKTIEVNMYSNTQVNFLQATQVEVAELFNNSFDWLRVNQPMEQPLIDDRGDTYEIFPTFRTGMNLINAIKIIYFLTPTPYVNISDVLTYPDTLDYYILALKVVVLYYESLNKFNEAAYWQAKYENRLERLITTLDKGLQQPIKAQTIPWTGFEF